MQMYRERPQLRAARSVSVRSLAHTTRAVTNRRTTRCVPVIRAGFNFPNPFENKGGGNKEDAAKKAIQDSLQQSGSGAYWQNQAAAGKGPAPAGGPPSGFSSLFGGAGGGGGGGSPWSGGGGGDEYRRTPPMWVELLEFLRGMWVWWWNCFAFFVMADILHRSLDWCARVETLLYVGAGQQALEQVGTKFFTLLEFLQEHLLGWRIPRDEDDEKLTLLEALRDYWPEWHASAFAEFRYPDMTEPEKEKVRNLWALRYWERQNGFKGDVDEEEVHDIIDQYDPREREIRELGFAQQTDRMDEYWAKHPEEEAIFLQAKALADEQLAKDAAHPNPLRQAPTFDQIAVHAIAYTQPGVSTYAGTVPESGEESADEQ